MADTGWLDPGSVESVFGTQAWADPENAAAEDTRYASVGMTDETSDELYASDFGAALPAVTSIDGVEVRVLRYFEQNGGATAIVADHTIRLTPGGTATGDNKAGGAWPEDTPAAATYGGAADVWSCTLNQSVCNNANFGVVVACEETFADPALAYVDVIQMKIYYTEAAATGGGNFFLMF